MVCLPGNDQSFKVSYVQLTAKNILKLNIFYLECELVVNWECILCIKGCSFQIQWSTNWKFRTNAIQCTSILRWAANARRALRQPKKCERLFQVFVRLNFSYLPSLSFIRNKTWGGPEIARTSTHTSTHMTYGLSNSYWHCKTWRWLCTGIMHLFTANWSLSDSFICLSEESYR